MKNKNKNNAIEQAVNASRREFVANAVKASAFAVPLALGVETLAAKKAYAQSDDSASSTGGGTTGSTSESSSGAASVPEPAAVALLGMGLASLALQARRRQKNRSES